MQAKHTASWITDAQRAFLSNGLAADDELRTYQRCLIAGDKRIVTTNGHLLYSVRDEATRDRWACYDAKTLAPVEDVTAPYLDQVLPEALLKQSAYTPVVLNTHTIGLLRVVCAAALGASKELAKQWRRTSKKQRPMNMPDASVLLAARGESLRASVIAPGVDLLGVSITPANGAEFVAGLDAGYLYDALAALQAWSPSNVCLRVAPAYKASDATLDPVILHHEADLGAHVVIMPRRA